MLQEWSSVVLQEMEGVGRTYASNMTLPPGAKCLDKVTAVTRQPACRTLGGVRPSGLV